LFKLISLSIILSFILACGESEESVSSIEETDIEIDTALVDPILENQTFEWYFVKNSNQMNQAQTDVALLVYWDETPDTVKFFTALGTWTELDIKTTTITDFPENCTTAIESKTESCFWAIRELSHQNYEILFGGIENNAAYAVLNYGFFKKENQIFSYEVGDPEVVEVYTQFGLDL
jgi:hypothetical protein